MKPYKTGYKYAKSLDISYEITDKQEKRVHLRASKGTHGRRYGSIVLGVDKLPPLDAKKIYMYEKVRAHSSRNSRSN